MTKYMGKNMVMVFGAFTFPDGSLTSVDWPRMRDEAEATGAGQLDKEFFESERSSTITINAWDDAEDTIRTALENTTGQASAVFYKQGTSSGKPTRTATAFVTNISDPLTHNQPAPITVTLRVNGAVTPGSVGS